MGSEGFHWGGRCRSFRLAYCRGMDLSHWATGPAWAGMENPAKPLEAREPWSGIPFNESKRPSESVSRWRSTPGSWASSVLSVEDGEGTALVSEGVFADWAFQLRL